MPTGRIAHLDFAQPGTDCTVMSAYCSAPTPEEVKQILEQTDWDKFWSAVDEAVWKELDELESSHRLK